MSGSWKVAYADFVTAMMAFFLLMWILNMVPPESKKELAAYFAGEGTFDSNNASPVSNNPFIQSTDKIDTRDLNITEVEKSHYAIAKKLQQMLMADAVPQSASGISADDVGVLLRVNSDSTFLPGQATLSEEGKKILNRVRDMLLQYNLYLMVRGHADTTELQGTNSPFASNWELSGARSAAAVHYLVEHGIKATRLRSVAYADTRPLEPSNSTSSNKNRRVEFYFHRPEVMSYGVVY